MRIQLPPRLCCLLPFAFGLGAFAQGSAFTYQGRLGVGGTPANGTYDLTFTVFATNVTGLPLAGPQAVPAVGVSNSLFTAQVDLGAGVFSGPERWLEIGVRTNSSNDSDPYTTLVPRQKITASPYSIFAGRAASADSLTGPLGGNGGTLTNLNASQLTTGTVPTNVLAGFQPPYYAFLGGGQWNTANNTYSVVAGGAYNNASYLAAVGGGINNNANGYYATVPGGNNNQAAGQYSFAAGNNAGALHQGAFVWADSQGTSFASTTNDQFLIRARGGVGIGTNNPNGAALAVDGTITATAFSGDGAGLANLNGTNLASNSIGAGQLAAGAAAANLSAGGQSAVASGGIVLSEQDNSTSLLNAGYVKIGKLELVPEKWTAYASGPATSGTLNMARTDHSAVWTGTEMIIWGGYNGSYLNDGARYNPALNSWTVISRTSAPSPRAGHSAMWTGTQMLIWGGPTQIDPNDTGARYNPSTDTWSPISTVNAPVGWNTPTWCNGYMVTYGYSNYASGFGYDFALEVRRYNPSADTWLSSSTNGAPSPRNNYSAVSTGTEVIIWGGEFASGFTSQVYANGARYNPSTDTWTAVGTTGTPRDRAGHKAVWTGSQMLVWGGSGSNGVATSGDRYTLAGNSWSPMTATGDPGPRKEFSAVWAGTRLVVWGGRDLNTYAELNTGSRYDPAGNAWSATDTGSAPLGRHGHTAVWSGSQMIIWGGDDYDINSAGDTYLDAGGRYTVTNNTWTSMAASPGSGEPGPRQKASAVWTGTEMLIWGGEANGYYLHSGGRFNPALNSWFSLSLANAPSGRINHTAVWSGSEMLIWGGYDVSPAATGGRYNPVNDTWQSIATSNAPSARQLHAAVWMGNEMLVWGGTGGSVLFPNYPTSGGRYSPSANLWLPMSTNNAPAGRSQPSAIWTGNELIVWGGTTYTFGLPPVVSFYPSGGRYSPSSDSWTPTPLAGGPSARTDHRAVWTGKEMMIWGGASGGGTKLNTGARFDPATGSWTAIPLNNAPAARSLHAEFWDGSRLIIWGGEGAAGTLNDGARFDPLTGSWTYTLVSGSAPAKSGASYVWTGSEMLAWGGTNSGGYWNTTYGYTPGRTTYLYLRP